MNTRPVFFSRLHSPLGTLLLTGDGISLTGLYFDRFDGGEAPQPEADWVEAPQQFAEAARQLAEYFSGTRRRFSIPLAPQGTAFQQTVWRALCSIPHGATRSYGELAAQIHQPAASRAVGAANGRNPIAILIPCHRVIGKNGTLTGYGGGLERKRLLLELEGSLLAVA
ncbi:MAG: methylated-DNA--[protein]-cysteine S-methyltransferase [Verrucomicrobiales bacterium]|nr:methylated-DNA--[protein]-cysteine S-methyltransferase [Verrucomicrobiales bacterium]